MMNMTLEDLATDLLFGGVKTSNDLDEKINGHWEYRKNKGFDDVNKAIKKGIKIGIGKTEMEIDGVALYLKDVFKKSKVSKETVK